jgi:hypothetical protein
MTLITVINQVCDVVVLDQFESVYGSDDANAQTMVALAKETGDEIARRADWQAMLKTASVVSTPYPLPADFQRLVAGGAIRTAAGNFFRLVTEGSQWVVIEASASVQPFFSVRGKKVLFAPVQAAVGATVEYVSKNWIIGDPYAERDGFKSDDDKTAFPERLLMKGIIWRWKRQKGLSYEDELAEFEADLQQEAAADRGAA